MAKKLKDTASEFGKLEAIKKLNEELTAENARLLTELEQLKNRKIEVEVYRKKINVDISEQNVRSFILQLEESNLELADIQSKWWYKLFTWKW